MRPLHLVSFAFSLASAVVVQAQITGLSGDIDAFDFDAGVGFWGRNCESSGPCDLDVSDGYATAGADSDGGLDGGRVTLAVTNAPRSVCIDVTGEWKGGNGAWHLGIGFTLQDLSGRGWIVEESGVLLSLMEFEPDPSSATPGTISDLGGGVRSASAGDYVLHVFDPLWDTYFFDPTQPLDETWAHANGTYLLDLVKAPLLVPDDFVTIQAAVNAAGDGDEIIVSPGTYSERINLLGKAITLRSTDPNDPAVVAATIIDGQGLGTVVTCDSGEGTNTEILGLTIRGGHAESGGGVFIAGSSPQFCLCAIEDNTASAIGGGMYIGSGGPKVMDCTLSGNSAGTAGGGMYGSGSSAIFDHCSFVSNSTTTVTIGIGEGGGGVFNVGGIPEFHSCTFEGNTTAAFGGAMNNTLCDAVVADGHFAGNQAVNNVGGAVYNRQSHPAITNAVFTGNIASSGAAIANIQSNPTIVQCSMASNASVARQGAGVYSAVNSAPTVANCIVRNGGASEITDDGSSTSTVTYCNVQGAHAGAGNIDADPLFVDADGPDNILGTIDDDLRLVSGSPSIDAGGNLAVPSELTTDADGHTRFADDIFTPDTGSGSGAIVDMGAYEFPLRVRNVTTGQRYITIQEAIDDAVDGEEIEASLGTYVEQVSMLGKAITLRSTDPTDWSIVQETILRPTSDTRALLCNNGETAATVISGLTFGPSEAGERGGVSITSGSPRLSQCRFEQCTERPLYLSSSSSLIASCRFVECAGAIWTSASNPLIVGSRFVSNAATFGPGGIVISDGSNAFISGCIFVANSGGEGAILVNTSDSSATIASSTFIGNTASLVGNSIRTFGLLNVVNCIFRGSSGQVFNDGPPPVISYSNIQGGYSGTGNIDADPLFVDADGADNILGTEDDDLHLAPGSPCIDAGDNSPLPPGATDHDNLPRFVDDPDTPDTGNGTAPIVDMGVYEFQVDCPADADGDLDRDLDDLQLLLFNFGGSVVPTTQGDADGDGDVDLDDLQLLLFYFGTSCN
ncbi:MAG: hypothetical protein KDA20_05240 [Phycisphaerales bacterium]|nr:hypothetical protein [Phycisphaerales bacterium]